MIFIKEFISFIIYISILSIVSNLILNYITKKHKVNINVINKLKKEIFDLELNTKIITSSDNSSSYNAEENTIELEDDNSLKILCEGYHELGHAFFNMYKSYIPYSKKGNRIYYMKKEIEEGFLSDSLEFLLRNSCLIALCLYVFSNLYSSKIFSLISFVFSTLSVIVFSIILLEEVKSTKFAYSIIRKDKIITKWWEFISLLNYFAALSTYIIPVLLSGIIIYENLLFIFS